MRFMFTSPTLSIVISTCELAYVPYLSHTDTNTHTYIYVISNRFTIQDHAGHIFGVDSNPMIDKLEQYNEVIKVLNLNFLTTKVLHLLLIWNSN